MIFEEEWKGSGSNISRGENEVEFAYSSGVLGFSDLLFLHPVGIRIILC